MEDLGTFYEEARETLIQFHTFIEHAGLADIARIDHIGYKCGSTETFERMRGLFAADGRWFFESTISDRRIAYIRMVPVLPTRLGHLSFLELSDQKPDGSQTDGFDHIEAYPSNGDYSALVNQLIQRGVELKEVTRPHHTTHDHRLPNGLVFRLTHEPLIEKIKREEMK